MGAPGQGAETRLQRNRRHRTIAIVAAIVTFGAAFACGRMNPGGPVLGPFLDWVESGLYTLGLSFVIFIAVLQQWISRGE